MAAHIWLCKQPTIRP